MSKKDTNKEKNKNNFFKELKGELKKVTWPNLKTLVNNTSAVISVVLIVAVIVFVLDVCFENLNDFGVGKLKSVVSSDTEETQDTENTGEIQESTDLDEGIDLTPQEGEEENTATDEVNENDTDTEQEVDTENNSEEEVNQ